MVRGVRSGELADAGQEQWGKRHGAAYGPGDVQVRRGGILDRGEVTAGSDDLEEREDGEEDPT